MNCKPKPKIKNHTAGGRGKLLKGRGSKHGGGGRKKRSVKTTEGGGFLGVGSTEVGTYLCSNQKGNGGVESKKVKREHTQTQNTLLERFHMGVKWEWLDK